jgi:type I restriction enzyme, S subunit
MSGWNKATWREVNLGDAIEVCDHKRVPLSTKQRSLRSGPYPYYGASGVIDHIDDYIFDGKYLLISEDGANLTTRNTPIAFIADGKFWVNNHAHVVRGRDGVADNYFLLAFLENVDISGYITGTAQPKLSQANLRAIKLRLPPLRVQERVAGILSAYGELIENNTRRIAILEEMVQAIYREWFVNLRFPGHGEVELVESELGPVPTGWQLSSLETAADFIRAPVDPQQYREEQFAHFSIPAFDDGQQPAIDLGEAIKSNKYGVPPDVILLSKLNPRIPRVWLPRIPEGIRAVCSTEFMVLKPKGVSKPFLFALISSEGVVGRLVARAGGTSTSHQRVKPDDIMKLTVLLPDRKIIQAYTECVDPLFSLIGALRQRNVILRQTRDLVLPKLISGDIDLSEGQPGLEVAVA